ncbi:hypothetical protein RFI_11903, partial [Reticulomyxa filosa]
MEGKQDTITAEKNSEDNLLQQSCSHFTGLQHWLTKTVQSVADQTHESISEICDSVFVIGNDNNGGIRQYHVIGSLFAIHKSQPSSYLSKEKNIQSLDEEEIIKNKKKYVQIEDISKITFEFLLSMIYGLNPKLTESNCVDILYISKKYLIHHLTQSVITFIIESIGNNPKNINKLLQILMRIYDYGLQDELNLLFMQCKILQMNCAAQII